MALYGALLPSAIKKRRRVIKEGMGYNIVTLPLSYVEKEYTKRGVLTSLATGCECQAWLKGCKYRLGEVRESKERDALISTL